MVGAITRPTFMPAFIMSSVSVVPPLTSWRTRSRSPGEYIRRSRAAGAPLVGEAREEGFPGGCAPSCWVLLASLLSSFSPTPFFSSEGGEAAGESREAGPPHFVFSIFIGSFIESVPHGGTTLVPTGGPPNGGLVVPMGGPPID